ncbi:MAG: prolipoprotein diacylglyceryl transferase [Deltaproteobacteria bacterium]|nr:prolipoprotein diacylglyceryl transferase [Deltaproteobacteria bacterium]
MHPILFKIPLPHWKLPQILGGGELHAFPIYAYGVMLGLSLVVGWYISLTIAKQDGLPRETMANNYVFTAIMAIVGARVLYILTNLGEFHSWKDYLAIRSGGLVAYGGFLGGFIGSWIYCKRKGVRLLAWADAAVPSLASGLLFTRIGCYLFGCDFGKPLTEKAPKWLQKLGTFPEWHYDHRAGKFLDSEGFRAAYSDPNVKPQILSGSPAWVQHTENFPSVRELHHSMPVHPTQIYESLTGLFLLAMLFWARKQVKDREARGEPFFRGELFLVFTFGYGVLRFLLEIVRDDAERGTYGPHFEPHVIYPVALMALALSFWFGLSNIFKEKARVPARIVAILIPFAVFMLMRPANRFAVVEMVQLSTSQWIALITGIAAAAYYRRGLDIAVAQPALATDLGHGVPELIEMEAALERGEEWPPAKREADEDEADEAAPKKAAKKVTVVDATDEDEAPASSKKPASDEDEPAKAEKSEPKAEAAKKADEGEKTKSSDDEAST